jgi:NAD(P)-dependent dehydrogenase (short-subunit alcohol dehydrogenase family)
MIIFTGASGDLGSFLLHRFYEEGFEVVGVDVSPGEKDWREILKFECIDVSDWASLNALWKSLDFKDGITLVNLVGSISTDSLSDFFIGEYPQRFMTAFEKSFDSNLSPAVNCTMSFAYHAFTNNSKAHVINFGSVSSWGVVGQVPYGSAKGALQSFSRVASVELGAYGVRVNCIMPGYVDSPSLRSRISEERVKEIVRSSSLRQLVNIEDIFHAVKFLHESKSISGSLIEVHSTYGL